MNTKQSNRFALPRRIRHLSDLAYNLWWTWDHRAERTFKILDPVLWDIVEHNPVRFLTDVRSSQLKAGTQNPYYLDLYDEVIEAFNQYMESPTETWYGQSFPDLSQQPVAYFSTEFGLHESLPFYAGGLGVLSGDYLKEASDLGIPMVAVGFFYTQGYFRQRISDDGWQEAHYESLDFHDLPVLPIFSESGEPATITIDLPGREVHARLWWVQVGRVQLYLLDTNVPENQAADRALSARLYTSDLELRISQEIILGIGGVRALRVLGYNPAAWHMNEGHSAFLALERAHELVASGHSFDESVEIIRDTTIFTTHTPVPAGHDEFPLWLMDKYFSNFWPGLELDRESFIDLARHEEPWGESFSMAVLAMRMSKRRNGVSEMHGRVARKMWNYLWPELSSEQVPISHITNGIHTGTWLARRLKLLLDLYLVPDWLERVDDPEVWLDLEKIPDHELWQVRRHLKRKLTSLMRDRVRKLWTPGKLHPVQVIASGVLLDPYALTIGFARRFATYKRANLILHDIDRLLDLINRPGMPVQVIFAGKAHPADEPGKSLIQDVYRSVKRSETAGRLVFLEDYDMNVARFLVQGVDIWLNTPEREHEASGTSGQKAALNGVLNCSILDGWWREGFNGRNGWAIGDNGNQAPLDNRENQLAADAEDLYRLLEQEIIPLYYLERSADDLPGEWIGFMKESMRTLAPQFSMRRMVREYVEDMYVPALIETEEA